MTSRRSSLRIATEGVRLGIVNKLKLFTDMWRGIVNDVRTAIREYEGYIYIPDLHPRSLSTIVHPNMALIVTQTQKDTID